MAGKVSRAQIRRKKAKEEESEESEEEDREVIAQRLNEIKVDQIRRKRQRGLEAQTIFEQQDRHQQVVETNRSIKSLIGNQFSTQSPSSNPGGVSHDKILEKYIQEKVGTVESKTAEEKSAAPDELFHVSEELKALEGVKVKLGDGSRGPGIAWTTGIAEVALPIDYKLQNIEATELARKRVEESERLRQEQSKRVSGTEQHTNPFAPRNGSNRHGQMSEQESRQQAQRYGTGLSRHQMSSDDATLDRFKKRMVR